MSKISEFEQELQALLAKYDAVLGFDVGEGSDTHGLYDERLTVGFFTLSPGARFKSIDKVHTLAHGWSLSQSDLK